MTEQERIAIEMWVERAQGRQRSSAPKPIEPLDTGRVVQNVMGNLKVISNQADVRIRKAKSEYENAMRYGDLEDRLRAEAQLERAMKAAGLE